jgi:hypothetical protein
MTNNQFLFIRITLRIAISASSVTTSLVNLARVLTNTDRVYPFKKSEVLICSTI